LQFKPIDFLKTQSSAIIAGILVVFSAYALYTYFSNARLTTQKGEITSGATSSENKDKEAVLGTGGADTPERPIEWYATDYKSGDISGEKYTVKEGDTLWEIAEAKYGSGFLWNKIYEANKANIPYLSNGNPLIVPNQSLVLPN